MISAGSVKNVGNDLIRAVTKFVNAGLEGVEATVKGSVVKEITDLFDNGFQIPPASKYTSKATVNRAKGFGSVAGYLGSKVDESNFARMVSVLPRLSLQAQGALLAGIVKKVFANEGGTNE